MFAAVQKSRVLVPGQASLSLWFSQDRGAVFFHFVTFFVCTNRINILPLKQCLAGLVIVAKRLLKLPNLLILMNQKSLTTPEEGFCDFWGITNGVLH